jgi:hypothetical protein
MPRSYLLLRILTYSAHIQIQRSRVPTAGLDPTNWYGSPEGWKRTYNEMMELWGSLYELAAYRMRGAFSTDPPKQSAVSAFLRKLLLFELEPIHS